jgi:hypothetical protein
MSTSRSVWPGLYTAHEAYGKNQKCIDCDVREWRALQCKYGCHNTQTLQSLFLLVDSAKWTAHCREWPGIQTRTVQPSLLKGKYPKTWLTDLEAEGKRRWIYMMYGKRKFRSLSLSLSLCQETLGNSANWATYNDYTRTGSFLILRYTVLRITQWLVLVFNAFLVPRQVPDQAMWDSLWIKLHWDGFFRGLRVYSVHSLSYHPLHNDYTSTIIRCYIVSTLTVPLNNKLITN